jgi:flagellar hook-length control protein FliK
MEKQGAASDPANPAEVVKLWLSQYSQNVQRGKEALATTMQPKVGYEPAQMIADSHRRKVGPTAAKAVKPAGLIHLLSGKGKTHSGTVLPDPLAKLHHTLGKSDEGENGQMISISAKAAIAAAAANQQAGPKGISEDTVQGQSRKNLTGGPPAVEPVVTSKPGTQTPVTPKSQVPLDSNQMPSSHQELNPAQKPPSSDTPQTPAHRGNASPNQAPPSQLQSQAVLTGPNNPAQSADQARDHRPGASSRPRSNVGNRKESAEYALEGISPKKLNHDGLQLQVRAGQTKGRNSSTSKDSSQAHLERMLLQNNAQGEVAKSSSGASAHAAKTAGSPMHHADSPGHQVLEHIRTSLRPGDQQITIRLNPPELGRVLIKFEEQQQQITGFLEVSKIQTRYEIEQALPQIIRTLHDAGVHIKKLEVVLADQTEQQNFKDQSQSLHDGFLQEHKSAQRAETYNESADEWLTDDTTRPDVYQPQSYVTEDSIDMLL